MVSMATDSDFYIIAWQQSARIVGDSCMYIDRCECMKINVLSATAQLLKDKLINSN